MRQGGVVQRSRVLTHAERLAADLEDQRLADRVAHVVGRGDAEAAVGQPLDVLVGPGERHRGMNGQREAALLGQRRQHTDSVGARGMHDDRFRPHSLCRGQPGHHTGKLGVGHREQHQLGTRSDLVDGEDRGVGQATTGPLS